MRSINITKIICLVAFIGLAGFSCFWTAESLYIWLPSLTIYGAWLIAVVFYLVASLCFSKLLKSLDRKEDFYGKLFGRTGAFLLSFLGLVLFWLVVSLPTNTHTLLYRSSIKTTITNELTKTKGYLDALTQSNSRIKEVDQKYANKSDAVNALCLRLIAEMDNPSRIGIGVRFNTILSEMEVELSKDMANPFVFQRVNSPGTTRAQWLTTINYYKEQAYAQLQLYRAQCDREINQIRAAMGSKELRALINNTTKSLADINNMKGISNTIIEQAVSDLRNDYAFIKTNANYIDFEEGDKEIYTCESPKPEAEQMRSVPDVWHDYLFTDKYDKGYGFGWWVLIAALVDVAAFVFFNLAFNEKNNNSI